MRRVSSRKSARGRGGVPGCVALAVALILGSAPAPARAQVAADSHLDALFWESVATSDDRAQLAAYLARFPNGIFADLARLKIAAIDRRAGGAPVAAAPSALPPAAAPARMAAPEPAAPAPAAPAVAPAADAAALSDADLFASALGQSARPFARPDAVTQAIPPAPQLEQVPEIALPARFCSAEDRNRFHETVYEHARAVADENSRRTIEHVRAIRDVYDRFAAEHDTPAMTAVSREAAAYQAVSQQAYRESSAVAARYGELMAVPIGSCGDRN